MIVRILMVGGGTAGHINPAIAIADILKQHHPDAEILFVGAKNKMEEILVPKAGYALKTVVVKGFKRSLSPKAMAHNVSTVYHAVTAGHEAARIIRNFAPDIAVGTGGYVCGPVLRKAAKMGIPIVLHESNALPGVTVKLLATTAKAVMVGDEAACKHLPKEARVLVTGNPLRKDFAMMDRDQARRKLGVDERPLVLSFGGSLGARHLNEAMVGVLAHNQHKQAIQWIVGTGRGENFERMQAQLAEKGIVPDGVHIRVSEYIDDMPTCLAAADLVISRCGAMTISELLAMKKPAILIPSPYVAENHQFHNAQTLVKRGVAVCIEEKDLTAERLWDTIEQTVCAPDALETMRSSAETVVMDAPERIYEVVREVLGV